MQRFKVDLKTFFWLCLTNVLPCCQKINIWWICFWDFVWCIFFGGFLVYCNYREITNSYSVITKRSFPHSLPNLGNILKGLLETLKKHVICKIDTVLDQQTHQNFI